MQAVPGLVQVPQEALQQVKPFLQMVEPHFSPPPSTSLNVLRLPRPGVARVPSANVATSTRDLTENEGIVTQLFWLVATGVGSMR